MITIDPPSSFGTSLSTPTLTRFLNRAWPVPKPESIVRRLPDLPRHPNHNRSVVRHRLDGVPEELNQHFPHLQPG